MLDAFFKLGKEIALALTFSTCCFSSLFRLKVNEKIKSRFVRAVLIIFFRVSRNLNFFENVSATVTRFELNFIHSKSVTVSLICDHIVSWSNMDLQRQLAGEDHVYIPPEYNDGLDIKQQHKI